MKNVKKLIVVLVMALVFTGIYLPQSSMSYASESSDVTKMLNAFKKHHYVTANKYAKKLKSTEDASERKMTPSMKKAFKSVAIKFTPTYFGGIYFVDMDGDNKAEMLVVDEHGLGNMTGYVYKYRNSKAVYMGQFPCGHSELVNYPGHRGAILNWYQMSYQTLSTVCLRNNKISCTNYGRLDLRYREYLYLDLKPLNNHMNSSRNKWILGF